MQIPTWKLVTAVFVIATGTSLAGYGEINLSFVGVLLMALSECAETVRLVMTQFMLQGLNFHPMEGVMYLAPACVAWMMLGVMTLEWQNMVADNAFGIITSHPGLFLAAASLGFVCNVLVFWTIQLCGALTLKVCIAFSECFLN